MPEIIVFVDESHPEKGKKAKFSHSIPNLKAIPIEKDGMGRNWNDEISSAIVTDGTWELWTNTDYKGECTVLKKGQHESLKNTAVGNRNTSSIKLVE